MSTLGRRVRAIDWDARTSGRVRFAGDLDLPGMLVGRVLRSPHPHARIVSIDTWQAASMPGVHAVVTMADLRPGTRYLHEGAADRPPLADGVVRYIGQEVAAVAAETQQQAQEALRAIRVEYQVLPAPFAPEDALRDGAPRLHQRAADAAGNVARAFQRRWGDPDAGRQASTRECAGVFSYPRVAHACMETHSTAAQWEPARSVLHLWTSTQAPYYVVKEVSHALGLQPAQVVCHEVAVGGGFGSKSKICEQEVIAGLLASRCARPVLLALSRDEEFQATMTRHGMRTALRIFGDEQGRLRAIDADVVVDNGAYNHSGVSVTAVALKAFGMIYRPDGVTARARLVDTAKTHGGQFRGYGSTQTIFGLECLLDEYAGQLGVDPIELRLRNANQAGDRTLAGGVFPSSGLDACLHAVRDAIGWEREKREHRPGRGVGVAVALHPSGSYSHPGANRGDCAIDVRSDGRARVRFGGADAGTGQRTILAQIAAHELGLSLEHVEVLSTESELTPFDMGAWSSRGTYYSGHACRLAASRMADRLKALAAPRLGTDQLTLHAGTVQGGGRCLTFGELLAGCDDAHDGVLSLEASFVESGVELPDKATGIGNASATYNFAAHAAVVEVDRRIGTIRVVDYVAAHDIGRALNPTMAEGQVAGAVAMGLGAALREELVQHQGRLANGAYLHYALPRAADLPRIRPILIEGGDPKGPYGAKGVGELGINPPAPAIANAVHDAIGVRLRDLPLTPDKVLTALAQQEGRQRRIALWLRPGRWWIALVRWAYPRGLFALLHRRASRVPPGPPVPAASTVHSPGELREALALAGRQSRFIGGGTDLLVQRTSGMVQPVRLVSTLEIAGLRGVATADDGSVTIGGATTLGDAARALGERWPMLAETIAQIATPQIREMATVAGNLLQAKRCWFYRNDFPCYKRRGPTAPCYAVTGDHRFHHAVIGGHRCQAVTPSDLATALVALDAQVLLVAASGARRTVALEALYSGPGETVIGHDEILAEVWVPAESGGRLAVFEKLNLYQGDFAIAAIAVTAHVDASGRWTGVRLALGGMASTPLRLHATEGALEGEIVTADALRAAMDRELDGIAHPLADNEWKLDAASGLAHKAAERICVRGAPCAT